MSLNKVTFGFIIFLMTVVHNNASRQSIKDILNIVQRIDEKLDKEERLREITSVVHLDASIDAVNKKLNRVLSALDGNDVALPRISDSSSVRTDIPGEDVSERLESMDDRLDRMEKLAHKIATAFEGAEFNQLGVIERTITQFQTDMNKKLQKMMNVVTSLYEMSKEIMTNFEGKSNPGQFIAENIEALETNIKEELSIMSNEVKSGLMNLKIASAGACDNLNDYDDFETEEMKRSSGNQRSSRRDGGDRKKVPKMNNSTVDYIIKSLGRNTDEIKQEIHQGIQDIDKKLNDMSERQMLCADHGDLDQASSVRDSKKIDLPDSMLLKTEGKEKRTEKTCSKIARNVSSPASCEELLRGGATCDGAYIIFPNHFRAVRVYCDMTTDGGGWTVIMRRGDYGDKMTSFHKNWLSYKNGFGDVEGEFWLGNDIIHLLSTKESNTVLRVHLEAFDGEDVNLTYSSFAVEDEANKYRLHIGPAMDAPSPASNGLRYHNNHPFSTFDRKNDPFEQNCAATYKGGWWFNGCYFGFLTGEYYRPDDKRENWQGMLWYDWKGNSALRGAQMMIRPPVSKI